MEKKISSQLVGRLAAHGYIEQLKIPIYVYGFELLISTIITLILMILISAVSGSPVIWLFFLLGFVPARIFSGGYHAKTHFVCYTVFSTFFALSCTVCLAFSFNVSFALITSIVLFGTILIFSPVEAINKPLSEKSRKRNRFISLMIVGIDIFMAIVLVACSASINEFFEMYYVSKWTLVAFLIYPKVKHLLSRYQKNTM